MDIKIRKVDNVGRVKIPNEILKDFSLKKGDSLEYFTEKNLIVIKKFQFK